MKRHILVLSALALGLASALSIPESRADVVGEVEARLQIELGCEVTNGSAVDGNINDFGVLDFGQTAPTWENALGAELSGAGDSGAIEVTCSPGVGSFVVSIDGGLRGGRTLLRTGGDTGDAADLVVYNVFRDAARSNEYAIDVPQTYTVPADGEPVAVPVYGAIAPNATAKNNGLFLDTLLVTIDL